MSAKRRILLGAVSALLVAILIPVASVKLAHAHHIYSGYRFQNTTVVWCFGTTLPSGWQTAYNNATITWSNASNWFLPYSSGCAPAKIWLSRRSFSAYGIPAYPGITYTSYAGGYVTSAFTYLNTDHSWSTTMSPNESMGSPSNPCSPKCDVETVVLHEIGHAVHFTDVIPATCPVPYPKTVMCSDYIVRRTLVNPHDQTALQAVYGP